MDQYNKYITTNKRLGLVNWMLNVSRIFKLRSHTFQSAVNIMDSYFLKIDFEPNAEELSQTAVLCLKISSMICEIRPLFMDDVLYLLDIDTDNEFTNNIISSQLCTVELSILEKLNYKVYYLTIWKYIKQFWAKRNLPEQYYHLAYSLANILLSTNDYLRFDPKILADKIINICIVLEEDPECYETLIEDELEYQYIHLIWNRAYHKFKDYFNAVISTTLLSKHQVKVPPIQLSSNIKFPNSIFCTKIYPEKEFTMYSKKTVKKIDFQNKLGSGTYGSVYKITYDDNQIAMKKIRNKSTFVIDSNMIREVNNLMILSGHPNIINIEGYYYWDLTSTMYIGLDLMDTSLAIYLTKNNISESLKIKYVLQLLEAINYMHSKGIMHRDLSASNILIKGSTLKIGDFGSARFFSGDTLDTKYTRNVCSINYRAMELLMGIFPYNNKIDIWSCGCLITEILTGKRIFNGLKEAEVINKIHDILGVPDADSMNMSVFLSKSKIPLVTQGTLFTPLNLYPNQFPIIYQMLDYNPYKRPNAENCLKKIKESFDS
ncbi:putative serine/threonine-protein kinase [Acanthamoeba castellanii mimivirus]|uniref:Putative serine/threonine-protein kinase L673 n=5 Tax=Mimivirus TaxID=315393 RepID=YL673_MIMIV|nr:putative serine/threonine-protein kinase [Acanthamoeba polyphaga mimivirus]Q5UNT1.1 RecName: Full=Putative serine/threonine-protein kinase L673 [Acanthamoeba polyphaga mimivirus]AHA45166.1 putative serine/threonine protein kinase [Hirudovirus strain Sangsue]ALR84263.1 putative serine/threonine-protein kinase [Niemeyer virus]AMK61993.1 serine threonine-protein kinase [Samba virus]AMZ03116.1 putative serine/threonine-protein kinase [Mimivirus Bombay]BAV61797.1 putative serine/threonine-prote